MPRCTRCGFVLGGSLPASELSEVFEEIRRALRTKLSALSRDATARLIRQHDSGHRLNGFLKIIQAAHTDALVRVLDDNLARYLGRLLDEKWDEDRLVVEPFVRSNGAAMRSGKRAERCDQAASRVTVAAKPSTHETSRTKSTPTMRAAEIDQVWREPRQAIRSRMAFDAACAASLEEKRCRRAARIS